MMTSRDKADPYEDVTLVPKLTKDNQQVFVSAVLSGVFVSAFCTPFDVTKNFLQGSKRFDRNRTVVSTSEVVNTIRRTRGVFAFWTGLAPTMGVLVPANFIFFTLYEHLKQNEWAATAGVKSRFAAVLLTAPFEFVRTKLQANLSKETGLHLAGRTVREEGLKVFFRGIMPQMIRDVPFSAVYWQLYETGKSLINTMDPDNEGKQGVLKKFFYPFANGLCTGAFATVISHPFDVIKTNMQSIERITSKDGYQIRKSISSWRLAYDIRKQYGLKGFYVGLLPRVLKVAPSCAIMIGTYELTKHVMGDPSAGCVV